MKINEKFSKRVGEKYTEIVFDNGFRCYIVKKQCSCASASLGVNYGSADTELISNGNKLTSSVGIAHFLEHKMYETEKGDAFTKYADFGGDANAYTANDKTVFYFSATENFYENLEVLLYHTLNASFNEKSVKKEKGIISEEIKMYLDTPRWCLHRQMMSSLYGNTSFSEDPAGSLDFIKSVTYEDLSQSRNAAYVLSNMILAICGDVDTDKIIGIIEEKTKSIPYQEKPRIILQDIKNIPVIPYSYSEMDVSIPLYSIGMRLDGNEEKADIKTFAAVDLIVGMLFSHSTDFYNDCYKSSLFEDFNDSCQTIRNIFFASVSGDSRCPEELYDVLKKYIEAKKSTGFTNEEFEREKKSLYADLVYEFDSPENITDSLISFAFEGDDYFEYPDIIASIDKNFAEECLRKLFDTEKFTLSVIKPKKREENYGTDT